MPATPRYVWWRQRGPATRSQTEAGLAADAGGKLFEAFALELWRECEQHVTNRRALISFSVARDQGFAAWATYPIRCMRIAEILGLLGLRIRDDDPDGAAETAAWLAKFIRQQPGLRHPISDTFAVCLIPPAVLLAPQHSVDVRYLLRGTTVWLCDRHDGWGLGLSRTGVSEADEISRIFGALFEHVRLRMRRTSQIAGVLLDLAALLGNRKLFADIRNDMLAVDLVPLVLRCRDDRDQYSLTALNNRWDLNPDYPDTLGRNGLLEEVAHHRDASTPSQLVRLGRPWDLMAVSSALRDRHFVSAIHAFV